MPEGRVDELRAASNIPDNAPIAMPPSTVSGAKTAPVAAPPVIAFRKCESSYDVIICVRYACQAATAGLKQT